MSLLVIVSGPPGAGKSSVARALAETVARATARTAPGALDEGRLRLA